jgi:hypothetical protein
MEISAIMNIHELAVKRTVTHREGDQTKMKKEAVADNPLQPEQVGVKQNDLTWAITKTVQQAETKEEALAGTAVTGNNVNIHT